MARKRAKASKKKSGKRKSPVRKGPKRPRSNPPRPVSTGRGPGPGEIGAQLVAMFNAGQFKEIEKAFWSPDVVSVEGAGVNMAWHGRKAVEAKNDWWMEDHEMKGATADGPYVGSSGFAVKFKLDILTRSSGQRELMEEVAVYQVKNGKIVREEFMYGQRHSAPDKGATPAEDLAPIGG